MIDNPDIGVAHQKSARDTRCPNWVSRGAAGITFEHIAAFRPDALGIVTTPDGTRVAWFKDPDGNMLSIGGDK